MSLPYERGSLLPDTAADLAKLRAAWRIVERRHGDGTLFNFSGLERSLDLGGAASRSTERSADSRSSLAPMICASVEFRMIATSRLTRGGIRRRSACGRIT